MLHKFDCCFRLCKFSWHWQAALLLNSRHRDKLKGPVRLRFATVQWRYYMRLDLYSFLFLFVLLWLMAWFPCYLAGRHTHMVNKLIYIEHGINCACSASQYEERMRSLMVNRCTGIKSAWTGRM